MRIQFLLLAMFPLYLAAQIADDFSDGDFTDNPSWTGDGDHFKISSSSAVPVSQWPALQLNAPGAGQSALGVSVMLSGSLEWHCWIKFSLNTSSGNYSRFYLMSDRENLKSPLNGYFIQIGGTEDSAYFCLQDSVTMTRLMRLSNVYTGNSTNAVRFKITRSSDGVWAFYVDPGGGFLYESQGECIDATWAGGNYFGIFCQYTSSNTSKFYFDDFYAGPLMIDTIPPDLTNITIINEEEILLLFNEAVDQESAENVLHYELNPGPGHPYEAIRLLDPAKVQLFFEEEFEIGNIYNLIIREIKDLSGNKSGLMTETITYYKPQPYDVIFSEIMADPSPPVLLPEFEYLELYNRSVYDIGLEGWGLQISSTTYLLPPVTVKSRECLLITSFLGALALGSYGTVVSLSGFNLPNNGSVVHLTDPRGKTVYYLHYEQSWYSDNKKAEGGWSLEIIDPDNPCRQENNWKASVNPSGGTPGKINFLQQGSPGDFLPEKICVLNNREIEINFNESVDSTSAADTRKYTAEPFLGEPVYVFPLPPLFKSVRLCFNQDIAAGEIYRLIIWKGFQNCMGVETQFILEDMFAIPQPCDAFDLVINEILFNPIGDGVDYIEIYNRSGKAISLDNLLLVTVKEAPPNPPDTQSYPVSLSCLMLLPEQYLVLTSDPEKVRGQYHTTNPQGFAKMAFPSYNNDKGYALLIQQDGTVIDGMHYSEEMHYPLLNSVKGVALERISPDRLGDNPDNWHSAAETVGFGTPGYQNSQFLASWDHMTALAVHPEVFSPDGDGRDDQLGIAITFDSPGKLVTVMIFNITGSLIRTLVNNELCGTNGFYSWDGRQNDGTIAPNGIYVVYLEALGMNGKTHRFKKACVMARGR